MNQSYGEEKYSLTYDAKRLGQRFIDCPICPLVTCLTIIAILFGGPAEVGTAATGGIILTLILD